MCRSDMKELGLYVELVTKETAPEAKAIEPEVSEATVPEIKE